MAVAVDAVAGRLIRCPGMSVADWIWSGPTPAEAEAAFVKDAARRARAAREGHDRAPGARVWSSISIAASYRLDAWETGLFAQRLQSQRRSGSATRSVRRAFTSARSAGSKTSSPRRRTSCAGRICRRRCARQDAGALLEEDDVGPATPERSGLKQRRLHPRALDQPCRRGALLRNAYLSHASSEQADMLSINLSSGPRAPGAVRARRHAQRPADRSAARLSVRARPARPDVRERRARRRSGARAEPVHRSRTAGLSVRIARDSAGGHGAGNRDRAAVQRGQRAQVDDRDADGRRRLRSRRRCSTAGANCRTPARAPRSWPCGTRCSILSMR